MFLLVIDMFFSASLERRNVWWQTCALLEGTNIHSRNRRTTLAPNMIFEIIALLSLLQQPAYRYPFQMILVQSTDNVRFGHFAELVSI